MRYQERDYIMEFYKLNGLGNDYIYFDCISNKFDVEAILKNVVKLSDRRFGIGSDGVILLLPSDKADVRMRMFNSFDGSEAQMCGNGARCVARLAYKLGLAKKNLTIEASPGVISAEVIEDELNSVRLKMFYPPKIADNMEEIKSVDMDYKFARVDVGNPHAVINVKDVKAFDVERYGKPIENNISIFPERTNVEFYEEIEKSVVSMRVWERGSGETLACGTGACATAAAYRKTYDNSINNVEVKMIGGNIKLIWEENDFYMQGGTNFVFSGDVDLNNLN